MLNLFLFSLGSSAFIPKYIGSDRLLSFVKINVKKIVCFDPGSSALIQKNQWEKDRLLSAGSSAFSQFFIFKDRLLSSDRLLWLKRSSALDPSRLKTFRIMQPNHTCFYDFSPKKIRLNQLSSQYTKKPKDNLTYTTINNFIYGDKLGSRNDEGNNEGVLSMYVAVDVDVECRCMSM